MIQVDGSYREGGGQIVRTATALSAFTGKGVKVSNIRAGRSNPGLRPQHVKGVETLAKLCDADLRGAKVGSQRLEFVPSELRPRDLEADIGTAGSVTLLVQSLLFPLAHIEEEVEVKVVGGTDVKWSPPVDYLGKVLLPILNDHGYDATLEVERRGYYPKGGGKIIFRSRSSKLKEFNLTEKGNVQGIYGISHASKHLKGANVADRQRKAAKKVLRDEFERTAEIKTEYVDAYSPGSGIQLWVETGNSRIGGNALGEKGEPSEKVGREAAQDLMENFSGTVDRYAADQLLPFLAVSRGKIKVPAITDHCATNQWVIQKFLDGRFESKDKLIRVL